MQSARCLPPAIQQDGAPLVLRVGSIAIIVAIVGQPGLQFIFIAHIINQPGLLGRGGCVWRAVYQCLHPLGRKVAIGGNSRHQRSIPAVEQPIHLFAVLGRHIRAGKDIATRFIGRNGGHFRLDAEHVQRLTQKEGLREQPQHIQIGRFGHQYDIGRARSKIGRCIGPGQIDDNPLATRTKIEQCAAQALGCGPTA